jgi:hypothetical protein
MIRFRFLPGLGIVLLAAIWGTGPGCARRDDDAVGRIARLQRAGEEAARIDESLLTAPSDPGEAADTLRTLDNLAAAEREWDGFRAWAAKRGRPETVAALDRAWNDYATAAGALRTFLEAYARASETTDQPGLDAKRAEDYVTLHNHLAAACDGLSDRAARLSPADFTSSRAPSALAP